MVQYLHFRILEFPLMIQLRHEKTMEVQQKLSLKKSSSSILLGQKISTMWGPPVVSWFANPIKYSYKYDKP